MFDLPLSLAPTPPHHPPHPSFRLFLQNLDAASQLHAVLLAERFAELGICADLTQSMQAAPHNR